MRRILAFHGYKAGWWLDQVGKVNKGDPEHQEGCDAYAYRQREVCNALKANCSHAWNDVGEWVRLGARMTRSCADSTSLFV